MDRYERDSIHVYHNIIERMIGDTFLIRDSVIMYKIIRTRDSIFTHRIDSIPYRVEVIKEVQRARNWFDWMCYTISGMCILLLILVILKRLSVL